MSVLDLLKKRIIVCDGAMGTMIQKYGLDAGELPEAYNFTHPEVIEEIYRGYLSAGSDFVSTNTFGANSWKLAKSGYTVKQVIEQAVKIGRKAGAEFVALDVAPIGRLMEPTGDLSFEEACQLFGEQIKAGIEAEVDLILLETFTDLYEMKAAAITARELTNLPILCSVTFQEDGRMLMGADPLTVVNVLQDLGIDAIGVNCSLGPEQMIPIVKEMLKYSKLPVLVQPNAGLPQMINGETVFDVDIDEFVDAMEEMIKAGVSIVGGCCGTTPDFIKSLIERVEQLEAVMDKDGEKLPIEAPYYHGPFTAASSATKTVILDNEICIIGERINPTGKKRLKEALKTDDYAYIENEAVSQVEAGAAILDINVGLPEIDEKSMMQKIVSKVSGVVDIPLQIDSASPEVIEAAVRTYNGKPIINSVNGKQEVMDAIFPIVKKYGACVIALTLDEKGLPEDSKGRVKIAKRIIEEAKKYGINKERIIVDCLTLTVSAQQNAGQDTLTAIREIKKLYGVKTTLGVSNVSFGLPERKLLNRTFLTMALESGLDAPITDPLVGEYIDTIRAFETLSGKDVDSVNFINLYGGQAAKDREQMEGKSAVNVHGKVYKEETLADIINNGYVDRAASATQKLLMTKQPLEIVEQIIIPALESVGKNYENGTTFLPQLVKSADTVKASFDVLKEIMKSEGKTICYGQIVMATVKGDIHDIGKNIVKVILENYGYEIIDLGKDTEIDLIIRTIKEKNIKLLGLSALMTTTVINMEETIKRLRNANMDCKVMVGGAVLNPEYASKIDADYYCKDAMEAVRVANSIFKEGS